MTEYKAAITAAKAAWNGFATLFNPASELVARTPSLTGLLHVFESVSNAAASGRQVLVDLVKEAERVEPSPPDSAEYLQRLKKLNDDMTALLQAFEIETERAVLAVTLTRAEGKAAVSAGAESG